MGRLKKDHSGWSTSGKWLKYSYPKVEEDEPRAHKKKNTRKWCKGREGVIHDLQLIERSSFLQWSWKLYKCTNCGKKVYR